MNKKLHNQKVSGNNFNAKERIITEKGNSAKGTIALKSPLIHLHI